MEKHAAIFVYGIVAGAHEDHQILPMFKSFERMSDEKAQVRELKLANDM